MKFKLILLFGILMQGIPKSQAHAKTLILPVSKFIQDTIRDAFNLKRESIAYLTRGQSPENMLIFYKFYLQQKDQLRADSLINIILESDNSADYRHKISLISYSYTLDTKAHLLFLSDPNKLKDYRTFLLKYNVSSLKSNGDKRAHFYDLAALDSAYYSIARDSLVKKQMGHHYNSLAWYSILTQKLNGVENFLNQSIKYDPQSKYPYSNLPLLFLLQGHYHKARALYIKLKDQPFDGPGSTFKDEFLEDFKELADAGFTNNDIKKITKLLNSKSTQ